MEQSGATVVLSAGHATDTERQLFTGQVITASHERPGAEWITTIQAADGDAQWRKYISKVYRGNTSTRAVVQSLADAMGIAVPRQTIRALSANQIGGTVLHGLAHRELDAILRASGFEWSIQDGALQILPIGNPTTEGIILLTAETGLIGVPAAVQSLERRDLRFYVDAAARPVIRNQGVKALSLLQPGARPGRRIEIRAIQGSGVYRVERATHTGDTRGAAWHTEIEGKGING
jgi:hypothetical protein